MGEDDKRRRNARPSKYRPRTEAQKLRRQTLWAARRSDRLLQHRINEEEALKRRLEELETALRDGGHEGVHRRRHSKPLEDIEDAEKRFLVLKARVERLQALWSDNRRKRETRGKIILGGALLAEAGEAQLAGDFELISHIVEILDRRVERPLDRLTVQELLGNTPLSFYRDDEVDASSPADLPNFDLMVASALGDAAKAGDATAADKSSKAEI